LNWVTTASSSLARRETSDFSPLDAHGLHEVVDASSGDPLHVGLADHRHQRLFGAPSRTEQHLGAVDAAAQFGDVELNRAEPRVPGSGAIAVARVLSLCGALAVASVALHRGLGAHDGFGEGAEHGPRQVGVAVGAFQVLAKPGAGVNSGGDVHRVSPQVVVS